MSLRGKTVVLTGASSGIGAQAAVRLHAQGALVHLVGRDERRTRRVAEALDAPWYTADFEELADVRRLADELMGATRHIDVLAANAGAVMPDRHTADGIDATFQVNVLSPWLLMLLLADHLSGGRILATNSRAHKNAVIGLHSLEDLARGRQGVSGHRAYARSKLAAGILLREYGRRHRGIDVGDFHPGIIASGFDRPLGKRGAVMKALARPFTDTPDQGAARLVHLASRTGPLAGTYYTRTRPAKPSPQLHSRQLGADLWDFATDLTSSRRPAPGPASSTGRHSSTGR
ncbi:SDR family NAD(P)-dependent oxidoreductase [Streptomyces coeruleorubidus]|uniref:SDR family NAD(P)-dependent oxidoreductase n=1 Tax=Streptomyces coeruleorubidus TaxID=116188 RepID=UPI001875401D|nr:SDR family NAD(P)-dependent oxidoreductase [Streptomyces bellus]GGT93065.1 short-chain dehydrogenase [Streptomyces bellus]